MKSYSTAETARRLSAILKEADGRPVIIKRHRRPRAALVSMRRFEIYEALFKKELDEMAAESLQGALTAACEGKLGTAARLRLRARSFMKADG
ncbi:MAG: type II toxin-antitoxin system Phd/YefM family antitoxin [Parvularculaceae bacterium]